LSKYPSIYDENYLQKLEIMKSRDLYQYIVRKVAEYYQEKVQQKVFSDLRIKFKLRETHVLKEPKFDSPKVDLNVIEEAAKRGNYKLYKMQYLRVTIFCPSI
jgi:hypothetical protein